MCNKAASTVNIKMTEIKPGKVIAKGANGSVHELFLYGMKFACKILHDHLVPVKPGARNVFYQKFHEEIDLLTKMRHPCIVQFVNVCYPQVGSPILVMEFLPTTLRKAIENYTSLPDEIVFSIFEDIALGLCFLHGQEPVVIHRDLSSNNILLDDNMRAKIGDLGMAKLIDEGSQKRLMSTMPGTAVFMPPEARNVSPDYKTDIDIFSFGVLMVFVFSSKWPQEVYNYPEDPKLEYDEKWLVYIEEIRLNYPNYPSVLSLVKQCLSRSADRPDATAILERIRTGKAAVQVYHGSRMKMIQQREANKTELERLRNDREKNADRISRLNAQVETFEEEKETEQTEKESLCSQIQKLKSLNNIKTDQIKTQDKLMETQRELLKQKEEELEIERSRLEQTERDMKESEKQRVQEHFQIRKRQSEAERDEALKQMSTREQFHMLHSQVKLKQEKLMETVASNGRQLTKPVEIKSPMTAAQYTLIKSTLYFGGGETDSEGHKDGKKQIWAFNYEDNTITQVLPPCPVVHFGLGNIEGKLVTVGGRSTEDGITFSNKVCVYSKNLDGTSEWKEGEIPDLPVARARVCVISQTEDENSTCIAACGGKVLGPGTGREVSCNLVEVYSKDNPHWITARHLPEARAALRGTVLHDTAYLMGGYDDMGEKSKKDCYSVSLSNLFGTGKPIVWSQLTILPMQSATPVHLCGTLLAIGGSDENGRPIHAYNVIRREWVHVADLATGLAHAAAATLPNGKALIIGGRDVNGQRNRNIFIVEITGQMF